MPDTPTHDPETGELLEDRREAVSDEEAERAEEEGLVDDGGEDVEPPDTGERLEAPRGEREDRDHEARGDETEELDATERPDEAPDE
jgi:hypothetical protein